MPVLAEYKAKRSMDELKLFVNHVAGTLGGILLLVTALGVLGSPVLVMIFAPGFIGVEGKMDLAADMLRLTFPYLLFISLTAFAGSILNTYNRFGIPAFTPVLLNLSLIGCAIWLSPQMERPIVALAWGVLLAGIVQFLFQLPFLKQLGLLPKFKFAPKDEGVRRQNQRQDEKRKVVVVGLPVPFGIAGIGFVVIVENPDGVFFIFTLDDIVSIPVRSLIQLVEKLKPAGHLIIPLRTKAQAQSLGQHTHVVASLFPRIDAPDNRNDDTDYYDDKTAHEYLLYKLRTVKRIEI